MKLYTEEQVRKAIELAQEMDKVPYTDNDYTHRHNEQNIIQSLTPIELPSDEELEEWIVNRNYEFSRVDIQTTKWVIEQIKQQDK